MSSPQADATGFPFATDPNYKAGQDPAGSISDGLSSRCRKGPSLDYIASPSAPLEIGATGSEEAIYGDTLDVTDADWLHVEAMFFLISGVAETLAANLAVGLESSQDGINWTPYAVVNRAGAIVPATMFRNDSGQTAGLPSPTGGYAAAVTTQNAPLLEDMLAFLATPLSTAGSSIVLPRVIPFSVVSALYVRVVCVPVFTEPPDHELPQLAVRVNKAVSP